MKRSKTMKKKSKTNTKIWWAILGIGLLLVGTFLLVSYTNSLDVRSKADQAKISFIDHSATRVEGQEMAISIDKPEDMQPGDMLVALIGSDYAHVDTLPSGWKEIRQDVKNKGHKDDLALQTYYKVVTSEEEAKYTWNMATKRKDTPSEDQPLIALDLYVLRGVDQNDPIFSVDAHGESKSPNAIKCPSVKGIAGGLLICSYMGDDPGTITAPETMTQTSEFEIAKGDSFATAYETLTSDGKTGSRVARWENPENKNGSDFAQAVVLRPAQ